MALLHVHKSKYGHNVSKLVCDQCGIDGLLPKQLHRTLYKVNEVQWACETHMILAELRAVTPDFIRALRAAQKETQ